MANDVQNAKISGYLEKKGKLRMVSSWKKYWFVLEGRLLLYYRSKAEYETISPCKGSITLGPPCSIKPNCASSCTFQIETRANTINLRAENRCEQEKWMQAILATLNQTSANPTKMSHFRYSSDNLAPLTPTPDTNKKTKRLTRQNTMPERLTQENEKPLMQRLQLLGAHTYGGSLQTINKLSQKISPNLPKNDSLRRLLQNSSCQDIREESGLYAQIEKTKSQDGIVMVENENYQQLPEINIVKSKRDNIYTEINPEILTENSDYCSVADSNKDPIYTTPSTIVDHNENKVLESAYAITKIYDVPAFENQKMYSEPDIEPELPPRPKLDETSSQSSDELKNKKTKIRKMAKMVGDGKKQGPKRNSFVFRILKKMRRSDSKEDDAVGVVDNTKVEVKVDDNDLVKGDDDDLVKDDIVILQQLQMLLDSKKQAIKKKIKSTSTSDCCTSEDMESEGNNQDIDDVFPKTVTEAPTLPLKQKFLPDLITEFSDLNCSAMNIPRPKLIKKQRRSNENVELKTIDEILDDLDHEKSEQDCRHKVKVLIEKFNEGSNYEEVEIRKKKSYDPVCRHSDDLNRLLAELCKVTNAPIMMPGATNSLVSTPLSDEEWRDLVPIRTRRFSEPDYDIPRPHSLLHIIQTEDAVENPMQPTRFFGPVLLQETNNRIANEKIVSITPDSLEIEQLYQSKHQCSSSIEEDRSLFSYTSHNYNRDMKVVERKSSNEDIYSRPQSYQSSINEMENFKHEQIVEDRNEYMDSLEPCELQSSTTF